MEEKEVQVEYISDYTQYLRSINSSEDEEYTPPDPMSGTFFLGGKL